MKLEGRVGGRLVDPPPVHSKPQAGLKAVHQQPGDGQTGPQVPDSALSRACATSFLDVQFHVSKTLRARGKGRFKPKAATVELNGGGRVIRIHDIRKNYVSPPVYTP